MKIKVNTVKILITLAAMLFMIFTFGACIGISEGSVNRYSLPKVMEGDTFEITLDSQGSTAYSWHYEISPSSGIEYVTQKYISNNDDPDMIGGGQIKYTFKAIKADSYEIKFELQIPWESKPPIETNIYEITVTK